MINIHLATKAKLERPVNILWIFVEDLSPWLPAWGDATVATPNMDRLLQRGTPYTRCFAPAPVCSPARSGIITGCYPTRIGCHNHVASRPGEPAHHLTGNIRTLPELFRDAGYFTYNLGKDDYNFAYDRTDLYHGEFETPGFYGHHHANTVAFDLGDREWHYWRRRTKDQPFFGQIGLWGGKNTRPAPHPVDADTVTVPACYPDTAPFREEVARHYECIQIVDQEVGSILDALAADELLESTAVFLFSDHGMGSLRHKQFCYDGGTHIPLILSYPKGRTANRLDDKLVSALDISATTLALAEIPIPESMDGQNFLSSEFKRDFVVSARDRCDYTIDRIRSIRTQDFRYIRNFLTDRPLMQPQYRDHTRSFQEYKRLFRAGELSSRQALYAGDQRPSEELYDHRNDPDEVINLADDPRYHAILVEMRGYLDAWIQETDDLGRFPESTEQLRALIQRWGADRCVNPEYETV